MTMGRLPDKVFAFTANKRLFSAPCHVLVGVSGGADSMALLHLLTHWPEQGLQVSAVHIHHGLRGDTADRDEQFVRAYCEKHRIPLSVVHANVATVSEQEHCSVEEAGRRVRYMHFESLRNEIGADYIVTAHTASDQAETVLMHLIRGCGVDGLCGIPSARGYIRRPFLCVNRQEIEEYCAVNDVPYIIDETNEDTQYTRNDIRHRVLPLLRQINPSVDDAILRLSGCAAEDTVYLNGLAVTALQDARCTHGYRADGFMEQPMVVRRRMIRQLMLEAEVPTFEETHILSAEDAIVRRGGSVSLPNGFEFVVSQGVVSIQCTSDHSIPDILYLESLPNTVTFANHRCELSVEEDSNVHKLFEKFVIDYDKIQGTLRLCSRQTGDYLHPAGRGIGKSVKKLMNEWHIPSYVRDSYPILCDDRGVVLIPGYACDERVRVTQDTKHFLVCKTDAEQG